MSETMEVNLSHVTELQREENGTVSEKADYIADFLISLLLKVLHLNC